MYNCMTDMRPSLFPHLVMVRVTDYSQHRYRHTHMLRRLGQFSSRDVSGELQCLASIVIKITIAI